jgi:ATP adenylyltransferase/5',5'''-P-1,P-4-tetraphosphate phosphorylase II
MKSEVAKNKIIKNPKNNNTRKIHANYFQPYTLDLPTSNLVAKACLFNEFNVILSKSIILILLTPDLAKAITK